MPEIIVKIDRKTYKVTVEGSGFIGNECVEPISKLIDELGAKTLKREPKPEMFYATKIIRRKA